MRLKANKKLQLKPVFRDHSGESVKVVSGQVVSKRRVSRYACKDLKIHLFGVLQANFHTGQKQQSVPQSY